VTFFAARETFPRACLLAAANVGEGNLRLITVSNALSKILGLHSEGQGSCFFNRSVHCALYTVQTIGVSSFSALIFNASYSAYIRIRHSTE